MGSPTNTGPAAALGRPTGGRRVFKAVGVEAPGSSLALVTYIQSSGPINGCKGVGASEMCKSARCFGGGGHAEIHHFASDLALVGAVQQEHSGQTVDCPGMATGCSRVSAPVISSL